MAITHILFDWDGTLARTLDLWLQGNQRSFRSRGYSFDDQTIVKEFFHNHHEIPARYPDMDFPTIASEVRTFVHRYLHDVALYDDALYVLDSCDHHGIATSLVSSSARNMLEKGLNAHGLLPRFQSTLAGDDGFGHKPDTRPFRETLNRVGSQASETLIIGDSHVDIEAGKALGCHTCFFAPDSNRLFHDVDHILGFKPDHVVSGWRHLFDTVPVTPLDAPALL